MTNSPRLAALILPLALLIAPACGGDDDDTGDDDGGGDGGGDDVDCGFDGDAYLPHQVGNTWTYRITDLTSGAVATKDQSVEEELNDETFGTVTVQLTGKLNGSTRSLFSQDGDRLLRRQQEDLDGAGDLEKTTVYEPGQLRIDESEAHTTEGAEWDESYTSTETPVGGAEEVTEVVDHWEVVATSAEVTIDGFGTFDTLRLRRTRTAGGASVKEFFFARGVGKVKESGDSQLEELTRCGR